MDGDGVRPTTRLSALLLQLADEAQADLFSTQLQVMRSRTGLSSPGERLVILGNRRKTMTTVNVEFEAG
jgi:hypothetical protein